MLASLFNNGTEILRIKFASLVGKIPTGNIQWLLIAKLKVMAFLGDIEA